MDGKARGRIVERLADLLAEKENEILAANERDLNESEGLSNVLRSRLALTPAKVCKHTKTTF